MGWLTDAFDFVTGFFDGGDVTSSLIEGGASLAGAAIASKANSDAAKTVAEGYTSQADAIREGNAAAQDRYARTIGQTAPATDYLRSLVALDPYNLTPGQKTGREDTLRGARNRLAASGLRGAGRAGVATMNEADRRFTDRAVSRNLSRADAAAQLLSGRGFDAANRAASADLNTGVQVSGAQSRTAEGNANSDLANAALKGSVVSTLSSFIANDTKNKSRESRYKEWKQAKV